MRIPFSLVFLLLVLAEIAVFIQVGAAIGIAATLGLTVLAMLAGIVLLRWQGTATLMRMRADVAAGRPPARPLADGAAMAVGALLLIVPGFITDLFGLLLFVPAVRAALWRRIERRVDFAAVQQGQPRPARGTVVELEQSEYGSVPRPDSPWQRGGGGRP